MSVHNHHEATAALAGGADIIDAKDPTSGSLGAVCIPALREICSAARDASLVTAALGDADDRRALRDMASAYAAAGAALVKVGFARVDDVERTALFLTAAVQGAATGSGGRSGVVAVAYADAHDVVCLTPGALTKAAVRAGTAGVLLDTANKHGPGLRDLLSQRELASWVSNARDAGLLVAVAGRLQANDLRFVRDAGADIAGVRGAACEGGRTGRVTTERVRALLTSLGSAIPLGRETRETPTDVPVHRQHCPEGRLVP